VHTRHALDSTAGEAGFIPNQQKHRASKKCFAPSPS
jgi:hypothetical protein